MTTPTDALKLARDALARALSDDQAYITACTEALAAIDALPASVPNATQPAWVRPLQPAAADVAPLPLMFPPPGGEEASVPSGEPAELAAWCVVRDDGERLGPWWTQGEAAEYVTPPSCPGPTGHRASSSGTRAERVDAD